jgi:hypothetical protein
MLATLACGSFTSCDRSHSLEFVEAARDGNLATVKKTLKDDPDLVSSIVDLSPGGTYKCESTPLELAAGNGHKDIVEILLSNKADVNGAGNTGWTALHAAARRGRMDMAELLLANKAVVDVTNMFRMTPLNTR